MRITYLSLIAALGALGPLRATAIVTPSITNRVSLTWGSYGPGTHYTIQSSTNMLTWTTKTNTTATNVSLVFVGDSSRMFRLSVSNAPSPSVTLAWDPSVPATDVAGYTIYWGTSSGAYGQWKDVGLATTGTITNLPAGATYYFAITAYSPEGLESDYSSEVVWQSQSSMAMKLQRLP
jgi:hypothetical protein